MVLDRYTLVEQLRRQIYGGQPTDDSQITIGLTNLWLSQAIAFAAKQNYIDSVKLDGVAYVNNSFYTTFKNLTATESDISDAEYKITLPQVPVGIGTNEGIASVRFKDGKSISYDAIPLAANQVVFQRGRRQIPNGILYYYEGDSVYCISPELDLSQFTAVVRMISGGDSADLDSAVNIPDDYMPIVTKYVLEQAAIHRQSPQDTQNDGADKP